MVLDKQKWLLDVGIDKQILLQIAEKEGIYYKESKYQKEWSKNKTAKLAGLLILYF